MLREDLTIEDIILLRRLAQNHRTKVHDAYGQLDDEELLKESLITFDSQMLRIIGNLSEILQGSTEGVAGYRIEPQFNWD